MRLPGAQAALRPLHAGDGRRRLRGQPGEQFLEVAEAITENSGRERTTAFVLLGRLDPPHRRRAVHPHRGDPAERCSATSAGPAAASWRCAGTRASRAPPTSRRCSTCCPATSRCRTRTEHQTWTSSSPPTRARPASGATCAVYTVSLLKAWWGDARHGGQRLLLRLPAPADRRRTAPTTTVMKQIEGECKGYFLVGENPAVGSANAKMQRLGMANLDWLVVRDLQLIESATFWKDGPEIETGELTHRGDRHRGLLPARRGAHREGRQLHQHPAAAAVAPQGGRAARRRAQRPVVLLPPRPDDPAQARRAAPTKRDRPILDLTWDYPTEGETADPIAEAVLAEINGSRPGRPALLVHRAEGRRLDHVRLLDLLRRARRRGEPGRDRASRASEQDWVAPEWALGVAGEPAHPLQPRVGRPGRQAVERAQEATCGGTPSEGKWVGRGRPRLRGDQGAGLRAAGGREGAGRDRRAPSRSSCRPTAGRGCTRPAGPGRRPAADALRAVRSPRWTTRSTASSRTRRTERVDHPANRYNPARSEVFPYVFTTYRLTEHHTAGGMSRTLPYLSELQPEFFCEVSPAARRRARASSTTAGRRSSRRGRRSRRGCWSPTGCGRCGCAAAPSTRSACPTTGARTACPPATRPTSCCRSCSTRTCTSRSPRRPPATSGRARRPRGPALLTFVEEYRKRAEHPRGRTVMGNRLSGPLDDPAQDAGYPDGHATMGFFTDTSVCIGCKACEVACKEWNDVPERTGSTSSACPTTTPGAGREHVAARGVRRAEACQDVH